MKKQIFKIGVVSFGLFLFACKKEVASNQMNSFTQSHSNEKVNLNGELYSSDGSILIFEKVKDFEDLIEIKDGNLLKQLSFLSYTTYKESLNQVQDNVIEDEFLSNVLNKDLAVQIGNYIYRINKPSEKVFALHLNNKANYSELISENISSGKVLTFSTEDNVFELLGEFNNSNGGTSSDPQKALSNNCRSSDQEVDGWEQYVEFRDDNNLYGNGTNKTYKFKRKLRIRYDNWGIFRKLFTEFDHKEVLGGTFDETDFTIAFEVKYHIKNGSSANYFHYPAFNFLLNPNYVGLSAYEFVDDHKQIEHYSGVKCLKAYDLKGWCWFRHKQNLHPKLVPNSGFLRITDGY